MRIAGRAGDRTIPPRSNRGTYFISVKVFRKLRELFPELAASPFTVDSVPLVHVETGRS
jgi:hypothetical protein